MGWLAGALGSKHRTGGLLLGLAFGLLVATCVVARIGGRAGHLVVPFPALPLQKHSCSKSNLAEHRPCTHVWQFFL